MTDIKLASIWEQRRTRYPNLHPRVIAIRDVFDYLGKEYVRFDVAKIAGDGTLSWKTSGRAMLVKNLLKEYKLTDNGTIWRNGVMYGLGHGKFRAAPLTILYVAENSARVIYYEDNGITNEVKERFLTLEESQFFWSTLEEMKEES